MHAPEVTFERARQLRRAMTLPEVLLWQAIRPRACREFRFRRQHPFGPYILDFYEPSLRLAVEVDGDYAHSVEGAAEHDARREAWLRRQGVHVLRLSAQELLSDVDGAVTTVLVAAREGPLSQLR